MNLKRGYIYIVKTTWGEVFEGVFVSGVRTTNLFDPIPFGGGRSKSHPIVNDEDIDWVEPICEMRPDLTETEYRQALENIGNEPTEDKTPN